MTSNEGTSPMPIKFVVVQDEFYAVSANSVTKANKSLVENQNPIIPSVKTVPGKIQLAVDAFKLNEDLLQLLADNDFKDFTFKVADRKIRVHKVILSARSPVFKAMFKSDNLENSNNFIEIKDASFNAITTFLGFIYCDKFLGGDLTKELMEELLYLGDKYEVVNLKYKAANRLIEKLDHTNAISLLILFDRHNVVELRQEIIFYIVKNKEKAFTAEKKLELERASPFLAALVDQSIYMLNRT